jgi:hypothetical protein
MAFPSFVYATHFFTHFCIHTHIPDHSQLCICLKMPTVHVMCVRLYCVLVAAMHMWPLSALCQSLQLPIHMFTYCVVHVMQTHAAVLQSGGRHVQLLGAHGRTGCQARPAAEAGKLCGWAKTDRTRHCCYALFPFGIAAVVPVIQPLALSYANRCDFVDFQIVVDE